MSADRQRVEILKVLYRGARTLILDEPTAVLVPQEVDALFDNLRGHEVRGPDVIFISHKLDEVRAIADEITVIRRGTTRRHGRPETVDQPPARRDDGRQRAARPPSTAESTVTDRVVLRVEGLEARRPRAAAGTLLDDVTSPSTPVR